jgi:hypothetical protein
MTTPYRFFDDWGLPQVLFQLALALPIFAVVEYGLASEKWRVPCEQ